MPFPTVIDAVIRAFEQAMPEHVTGGHFATHSGFRVYGRKKTGEAFNGHDSGHGGWGACAWHDGAGPFRTMAHGDTRLIPMELQETILPFRIEELTLRADSGGPGKFRGGLGFRKSYTILDDCFLQTNLDRTKMPPWGVRGGGPGKSGLVTVYRGGGGEGEVLCKAKGVPLKPGDRAVLETGGGGGYGDRAERDLELIARDLRRGYITEETAVEDYGVTIGPDGSVRRG
jgi:N-methylhydantoinase B